VKSSTISLTLYRWDLLEQKMHDIGDEQVTEFLESTILYALLRISVEGTSSIDLFFKAAENASNDSLYPSDFRFQLTAECLSQRHPYMSVGQIKQLCEDYSTENLQLSRHIAEHELEKLASEAWRLAVKNFSF
jgi:hypothetical protein